MKTHLLSAFFLLTSATVAAQQGLYVKAEGGWGGTRSHNDDFFGTSTSDITTTHRAALSVGVQRGKFSLEAGLGYSRTGGTYDALAFEFDFDPVTGTLTEVPSRHMVLHMHYTLPMSLGYIMELGKGWTVQPRVGVEGAFNAWLTHSIEKRGVVRSSRVTEEDGYHLGYNKVVVFGTAAVQVHRRIGSRVGLFAGASYRHAANDFAKRAILFPLPNQSNVRTASATLDGGLLFLLKPAASRTASQQRQ